MTLPPPRVEEELDESARQVRRARERPDQKIADKLLTAKRWINWESVPDRNHPTKIKKIPIDPFTNRPFERDSGWQTDPVRWARFAEASAGGRLVGFLLGDGWIGIDFDGCIVKGKVASWVMELVRARCHR